MEQKVIFFDLGNVILFFSHEKMLQQIADFCGLPLPQIFQVLIVESVGERYERGELSSQEIYEYFCSLSQKKLDFSGLMAAASAIFNPNEAIFPIIKKLKEQNVRLILLSNTCPAHFEYAYEHYPILHCFDDFILSYKEKSLKPQKKIFKKALQLVDNDAKKCFYIDDIPQNIEAASQEGIPGVVFTSSEELYVQLKKNKFIT